MEHDSGNSDRNVYLGRYEDGSLQKEYVHCTNTENCGQ